MLGKWEKLRHYMKADIAHAVSYSSDKQYEHNVSIRYLKYMDALDKEERENPNPHIIDEKDLQGLS